LISQNDLSSTYSKLTTKPSCLGCYRAFRYSRKGADSQRQGRLLRTSHSRLPVYENLRWLVKSRKTLHRPKHVVGLISQQLRIPKASSLGNEREACHRYPCL